MEKIEKNFGFGFMRLPMKDGEVDHEEFSRMVDYFIDAGFNYFDTAHGYLGGKSEKALRKCLVDRYPREKYILTDKLTASFFKTEADVRPFFESQLEICGVDYFDFYLMHAQNHDNFVKFKECRAYEQALEFKKEGKIHHFGISFHDTADVLDTILTEYPQVEFVQIQLNYVDFDDSAVQSRRCYEVCRKHGKPVIVMEPVKGGNLVKLPDEAKKILDDLHGGSPASYAIRFAAGFDGIFMVLSGMSNMEQMTDNLSYMKDFKPLDAAEREAVEKVCGVFRSMHLIQCLPLLHRRMSKAYFHSRSVLLSQCKEHISRLERRFLLQQRLYGPQRQGVRLHTLRQMRKGLPAAPTYPRPAGGRRRGI